MKITNEILKQLKRETGVGYSTCKKALKNVNDIEEAIDLLREWGYDIIKNKNRYKYGIICSYIHKGMQVGSLVELQCQKEETIANPDFVALGNDIAMQVVATDPKWLDISDIPDEELQRERNILKKLILRMGGTENSIERKMLKFYKRYCLMFQPYIKDENKSVAEIIDNFNKKYNENIIVKQFGCMKVGI